MWSLHHLDELLTDLQCETVWYIGFLDACALQRCSRYWARTVPALLEALRPKLPRRCLFRCAEDQDLLLLWANLDTHWATLRRNGNTLLHMAAASRRRDLLAFVAGRDGVADIVNVANDSGRTALHLCAAQDFGVELLVRVSAVDVDRADRYGRSALVLAAEEEHVASVEALLGGGADINYFALYRPPTFATALASAVFNGNESLTGLLLCSPGINAEQPLVLGLPDAPTARYFAKTKSMLRLFEAHDAAKAPPEMSSNGLEEDHESLRLMEWQASEYVWGHHVHPALHRHQEPPGAPSSSDRWSGSTCSAGFWAACWRGWRRLKHGVVPCCHDLIVISFQIG